MGLLLPGRVQTSAPKPFAGLRGIWLLFLTTLPPSVLGLLLHSYIKQLFTPFSVSLSLAVGGLLMLLWKATVRSARPSIPVSTR